MLATHRVTDRSRRYVSIPVYSAVAAILAVASTALYAQEEAQLDEITVTGSRIVRRDLDANSPIVTIEQELFSNTMSVGIEQVMNQLPQFVPAVTQFDTTDVQASATNTPGASTLSLRGLGANRNLVLIDGRRGMPINASGAVSVNTIPSAAVARVETITGGASSVYGADAIAGVVNFILKRDYEGVDFDVRYGQSQEGDGEEMRLSGLFGANFAERSGNVLMGFEYATRNDALRTDRDFYRNSLAEPTAAGTESFWTDTYYASGNPAGLPGPTNHPTPAAVASVFGVPVGTVTQTGINGLGNTGNFYLNTDGTLYRTNNAGASYYDGPTTVDGVTWRKRRVDNDPSGTDATGQLTENQLFTRLQIPLDRYAVFGRGSLDLTDNVAAFMQANFSQDKTKTLVQYSPATGGWGATVPHGTGIYAPSVDSSGNTVLDYQPGGRFGLNCGPVGGCTNSQAFPVTPELATLLDSRANPNAYWQMGHIPKWMGPRRTENTVTSFQIVTGLEGSFTNNDWTWEAYVSHGSTQVSSFFGGFGSVERWRFMVNQPNYGRGLNYVGNPLGGGFAGGAATCTSGLPIMEQFIPSDDCFNAVAADLQNQSEMEQTVAEFNLQGKLVELPAGEARFAVGTAYRENTYSFLTDILTSQDSFLDSGMGLFPASNSGGETSMREAYGEMLLPLVDGDGFAEEFNLELGYRYSDAEPSGAIETYKGLFDWRVFERFRVRGGRQIANRAPNIGELFLSRTQAIGTSSLGDLCSEASTSALGANPGRNPSGAAAVKNLCRQLMGETAYAEFYGPDSTANAASGVGGFVFANTIGNPNLDNETAKTVTLGVVVDVAERTTLSVDVYEIEINNMIASQSVDSVYNQCFSPVINPTYAPTAAACSVVARDPSTGTRQAVDVTYSNNGWLYTRGMDVQFNWGMDVGPGDLGLSFMASYLDSFKTRVTAAAVTREWKGSFGPNDLSGVQGGSFDYRTFTTVNYLLGNWNASLRWRHMPSVRDEGRIVDPVANVTYDTESYDIIDASGGYSFRDGAMTLRYGIDNLFDKGPPFTNASPYTPGSSTDSGFYDVMGRRAYVGFAMSF